MDNFSRIFTFLILGLTIWACDSADSNLTQKGISKALANYRAASIKNLRYELQVTIPKEPKEPIQGRETIYLDILALREPLILDFKVPTDYLFGVIANGEEVDYSFENEHLVIDNKYLQEGENIIKIDFRVGENSLNRNYEFIYTLFVPDRARTAFPCFDQPNLKGKFSLSLVVPESWQAIANGAVVDAIIADGQKTIKFAETKPISSYLFSFVAGEFEVVERELDGRMMTMLHREPDSLKVARNINEIFNLHSSALNWLEKYTGIEYPFHKFGFALIPSFQYGGMEHPGAITYRASSLFLDESATQNKLMDRASLIAHETAHMWFGDLVTMQWFDDVWLKEVFANFMAAKIVNPEFPEINHDLRFLLTHYPGAYAIDRSKGTHPIQQPLDNLQDAGTLYGAIIYQKAPIVMRNLERRIGEELMQKGLHEYLSDFAYTNATWDDLIAILDSASEEEVTKWSDQWIKQTGMPAVYPYINTQKDSTIEKFSLYQRNFRDRETFWTQHLSVALESQDTMHHFEVDLEGLGVDIETAVGLKNATFIVCNTKGYGYGYFRLGPLTKKRLLEEMQDFADPVFRGVGWLGLWEGFLRQEVDTEELLQAILSNLLTEPDPLLQEYLLGKLSTIYWKFLLPEARLDSAENIENILWQRIEELRDSKLKSAYLKAYGGIALTDAAIDNLYKLWNKEILIEGINFADNDFIQFSYQLALRKKKGFEQIIDDQIARLDNIDLKARMQFIRPALSGNQAIRDKFFESLKDVNNRQHETWVLEAVEFLHHPLRAAESEKYISPTLEMLVEIQRTGDIFFPKRILDKSLWGHQSPDVVNDVRQFLYRNNHYPENLKNKILQSADLTFRAAEILAPKKETE